MSDKTRATLLDRLRDGSDALAWDEFFQRYWRLIYGSAVRRGCSEHTAEEIVQDVMLKVFQQRDIFRYDPRRGRFRDWLAAVVRNKVAEHRRRPSERVRPQGGQSDGELLETPADDAEPDAAWEAAFEQTLLAILLDVVRREVNPRDYLAFELFTLGGLPGSQVAEITGLSRNAVYKARRRVMGRLKELAGTYAKNGQVDQRLRQAIQLRPGPSVERSVTTRIENTMQSR